MMKRRRFLVISTLLFLCCPLPGQTSPPLFRVLASQGHLPDHEDSTHALAAGDVDGDGDLDFLDAGDECRLFLNNGKLGFSLAPVSLGALPGQATHLIMDDLDGDGDLDLLQFFYPDKWVLTTNLSRQVHLPCQPRVGRSYTVDFYIRSPLSLAYQVILPFCSPREAIIPLPPFGTFGLDPTGALVLAPIAIPGPSGVYTGKVYLPNDPTLIGRESFYQSLHVPDLSRPGLPWRFSNVAGGRIKP